MMTEKEIRAELEGEEEARIKKPNVYTGSFMRYSYAWTDALKFALGHTEEEVREAYRRAAKGDLDNSLSDAGYYKALRMVLREAK